VTVTQLCYSEEPEEYSDWKISFVVDVKEEKEAEGAITTLKLDLSSKYFFYSVGEHASADVMEF
jgi:hypothetical protein